MRILIAYPNDIEHLKHAASSLHTILFELSEYLVADASEKPLHVMMLGFDNLTDEIIVESAHIIVVGAVTDFYFLREDDAWAVNIYIRLMRQYLGPNCMIYCADSRANSDLHIPWNPNEICVALTTPYEKRHRLIDIANKRDALPYKEWQQYLMQFPPFV